MNKVTILVFVFLFIIPNMGRANNSTFNEELDNKITQLAALLSDSYAYEHRPARGVQILKKGIGDTTAAVAVFTLEGFGRGNNYFQYLAIFNGSERESDWDSLEISLLDFMVVGGKGVRSIEFDKINVQKTRDGILITIPSMEYGPGDGMCCPSIRSLVQFRIKTIPLIGSRLEEIKKKSKVTKTNKIAK
jgi:hypothetical protein